jgi:hypothetical protein
MPADSLNITTPDSGNSLHINELNRQSISLPNNNKLVVKPNKKSETTLITSTTDTIKVQSDSLQTDTVQGEVIKEEPLIRTFDLYPVLRESSDSAVVNTFDPGLKKLFSTGVSDYTGEMALVKYKGQEKGWLSGIIVLIVAILIFIRIYFQKYLSTILSSFLNIQVAEKLMREKNVIIRRVFFLLNLLFLLCCSLYIFLCLQYFKIQLPIHNNLLIFLCITGVLLLFLLVRLALQNAVGIIFEST